MSPHDIGQTIVNAFLYLLLLSAIGSAVADVIGQMFGVVGKSKRIISTIFCAVIVLWWKIGLFTILFGPPQLSFIPWFASTIDIIGTSLIVGAGSGAVFDMFQMIISKVKEWKEVAILNKYETRKKVVNVHKRKDD